ncbi:sulfatase-like hydrolase/transferase [bacterium]
MKQTSVGRREFIKDMGLGFTMLPFLTCAKPRGTGTKPNILFLFTDDQQFDTIQALNNPDIITPNMDRLAERGISFTRAHIMGGTSGAVCMPSRAMLLTGRTLFHLEKRGATIPDNHVMLPELLRQEGYQTFGTGKWHNGKRAFARCFTHGGKIFFGGMSNHLKVPVYDFDPDGEYPKERKYWEDTFSSELFSNEAIRFLENNTADNPFFMYVSYTAPHDPRMAPQSFLELYDPKTISLPDNFLPEHPFDNGEMRIRDEKLAPWPRTPEIVQEHIAAYYAMISHLDHQIGRVLDALEKSGKADNTIIVFASDNGLAVGRHGLLGKQNLYDHSVRVPLIMSGPGIPQGKTADTLCYLLDIYPTLCEYLNLEKPLSVEGKSLAPVLKRRDGKIRDSLFLAYTKLQRGVRTDDDWKLIKYMVKGQEMTQLFNVRNDPQEMHNLIGDPHFSRRREILTAMLKRHMDDLDDFCDLDKSNWGFPE